MPPTTLKDPTIRWFWTFAIAHFVVWTGVPLLTQANAGLDQIEMLYWGREWQWGYYKHPPLPAWIAELSTLAFGVKLWPLFVFSQLCLVGSFWAAWKLGRELLPPWSALAAVVLLEASWYHSYITTDFNNNTFPKLGWALFALGLYYGIQRKHVVYWAGAGLCLGLSMLSKYDAALPTLCMLAFSFVNARARACWKTPGPYVMTAVACLVFGPHAIWMVQNDFPTITYALRSVDVGAKPSRWIAPLKFLGEQYMMNFGAICVATFALGYNWRFRPAVAGTRFERDFIAFFFLGPLILAVLFAACTGSRLHGYWGASMFTFGGVFCFAWCKQFGRAAAMRRVVFVGAAAGIFLAVVLAVHNTTSMRQNHLARNQFPGSVLAERIAQLWNQQSDAPLKYVGGQWWVAGNVGAYHECRPSVFPDLKEGIAPWIDVKTIARDGMLVVWNCDDHENFDLQALGEYPSAELLPPIEIASQAPGQPPLRIGVAIVRPLSGARMAAR